MEGRHTARSNRRGILAALLASSLLFTVYSLPGNTEPGEGSAFLTYGKVKSPKKKWTAVLPATKAKKIATKRTNKQLKKIKKHGGKVKVRLKLFERYTFWGDATVYTEASNGGTGTACGIPFDDTEKTAAHKTIECGTKVVVTSDATGKSVTVTITDRGPYVEGRVLDLSPAAWDAINEGITGPVHVHARVA
ncbi:MAG: septal ring lytic transglycosylase RlpA family protein [Actinomycetota bacterium]